MKLCMCIPHGNPYLYGPWVDYIRDQLAYPDMTVELLQTYSQPIATARNELVTRAYYRGADYILFVDDDIWPPRDGINKLIQSNLPIVGGLCRYRTIKKQWVIFPESKSDEAGVIEVDETGCGFLLIKREVITTMAGTFDVSDYEFFKWAGSTRAPNGEDSTFCRLAKKAGFKIYIDTEVKCGHHDLVVFDNSKPGFSQIRRGKKDGQAVENYTIGVLR